MVEVLIKTFNELTHLQLYHMLQLRAEVFVVEQKCAYQDLDGKDISAHHVLLYKHQQLIGTCRLLPKGISYENYCSIGRVVVNREQRQHQHGKELMNAAIHACKELYDTTIKISAQQYLEKFYTELGFTPTGEAYLEDDIPHIGMIMKIN